MCILYLAIQQHPNFPLIIAANRDEFYARPTASSDYWSEHPQLLAGQDLQAGGTWMGVSKLGHIAALTNYRDGYNTKPNALSRGQIVYNYLTQSKDNYHLTLSQSRDRYDGFNLLFGHWQQLQVYSSTLNKVQHLTTGVYSLSNAHLDTPWPKVEEGKKRLTHFCSTQQSDIEPLFQLLADRSLADVKQLPKTGIPQHFEHALSATFIQLPDYGTRSSTVITVDNKGQLFWQERSFNDQGQISVEKSYKIAL